MSASSGDAGLARSSVKPVRLSPSVPLPFTAIAAGRPSTSKNTSDRLSLMSCISRGASTRKSNCVTRVVLPSASVLDCDEQVARVVFQRGDVAEGVGVALRQIEVLRRIRRKAGDAGADPVLAGQLGGRQGAKRASEICAAEVAADAGVVEHWRAVVTPRQAGRACSRASEDGVEQVLGQRQLVGFIGQTRAGPIGRTASGSRRRIVDHP